MGDFFSRIDMNYYKKKSFEVVWDCVLKLRYIDRHLRERALSSVCRYSSAAIMDGLNNLKEKKSSFGARKRLR